MALKTIPEWMINLEEEDLAFIKRFILASGSLKEMAKQYAVSYPTVRLRLDRLIQKVEMAENMSPDPYLVLIKRLALEERIDFETAKVLITGYRNRNESKEV